jgi:hypothetical protein
MPRIFISYRREEAVGVAGRVYDRLQAHFGPDAVAFDVDTIPAGVDFREHIAALLGECEVMLVVIGERWLEGGPGRRRLDEPGDFVRFEVETALTRGITIIPLLVGQAAMPREEDLPPSLAPLAYRNALPIDPGRDFHHHVDQLVRALEQILRFERSASAPAAAAAGREDLALLLPLLLPEAERNHLINLDRGRTAAYRGNGALRAELRHLRSIGLIRSRPNRTIGEMRDGTVFDLADCVELTAAGQHWARRLPEITSAVPK